MIWNTIAHPRMMDDTSGTSNTPESGENNTPIFSEEALAPPFKHMNRALLSTFDVIVMELEYDLNCKHIPLLGDFDTVYRAAKSGALLYVMLIIRRLDADQDGVFQPIDEPLLFLYDPTLPIVLEGKYENGFSGVIYGVNDVKSPVDFKDDRFVCISSPNFGLIFSSAGEIYSANGWYNDILPKYIITGTDSESENHN